jgi:hypothetical protein
MALEGGPDDKLIHVEYFLLILLFINGSFPNPYMEMYFWFCTCTTPRKIVNLLSKVKFDGEGETYASEHIIQFLLSCFSHKYYS